MEYRGQWKYLSEGSLHMVCFRITSIFGSAKFHTPLGSSTKRRWPREASLPAGEKAAAQGTVSDDDDPEILARAFLRGGGQKPGPEKKLLVENAGGTGPLPPPSGPCRVRTTRWIIRVGMLKYTGSRGIMWHFVLEHAPSKRPLDNPRMWLGTAAGKPLADPRAGACSSSDACHEEPTNRTPVCG